MIKCGSRALFKFYFSWFVLISFIIFYILYGKYRKNSIVDKGKNLYLIRNYMGYALAIPMGYVNWQEVEYSPFFQYEPFNNSSDYTKAFYIVSDYFSNMLDVYEYMAEFDNTKVHFMKDNLCMDGHVSILMPMKYSYDDVYYLKDILVGNTKNYTFLSKWELLCKLCVINN